MQNGYKKKVLILGGTGFIGRNLSIFLLKKNFNVNVVCKNKPKKFNKIKNIKYINLNLNNHKKVKETLKDEYQYIINSSGYVDHSSYRKNGKNILKAHFLDIQNIIEIFVDSKKLIKFIQIGSGDEYGINKSPMKESYRENPKSPYSYSKLVLSNFLQMININENFPAAVIRVFLAYGPYQESNRLIPLIVQSCLNNQTFAVSPGTQIRDFCYIDDVCEAILKIMHKEIKTFQIYNVGSGNKIKVKDLINNIVKIVGKGNPLFGKIKMRKQETKILYPDLHKIKKQLNWKPKTSLNKGLRKTINYIKKNN